METISARAETEHPSVAIFALLWPACAARGFPGRIGISSSTYMGVPHLTALLRPHAEPVEWRTNVAAVGLLLDGPSLAYFIFHKCFSENLKTKTSFDAVPSYDAVACETIAWLDRLRDFGFIVKQIFFDGLLPKNKIEIRLQRLKKSLDQLVAYRTTYPDNPVSLLSTTATGVQSKKSQAIQSFGIRQMPAPPFLVPAVLEALQHSSYKARVRVVPCEADVACTDPRYCQVGDMILTSDSDLLVHDHAGSVVFFADLDVFMTDRLVHMVKAMVYRPRHIARKLGLPDLEALAFYVQSEPHNNLGKSVENAQTLAGADKHSFGNPGLSANIISALASFRTFAAGYHIDTTGLFKGPMDLSSECITETLDPRVSEVVQQSACGASIRAATDRGDVNAFLPFLIDDPKRISAWHASFNIRRLAYSVLFSNQQSVKQLMEAKRSGYDRIVREKVMLLGVSEHSQRMFMELLHLCQTLRAHLPTQDSVLEWRTFAISMTLSSIKNEGRTLPSRDDAVCALRAAPIMHSWSQIHARAQVDGMLYSLRILRQVLEVLNTAAVFGNCLAVDDVDYLELLTLLRGMPSLRTLMDASSDSTMVNTRSSAGCDILAWYYPLSTDGDDEMPVANAKRQNKRRKIKAIATESNADRSIGSRNIFEVLRRG